MNLIGCGFVVWSVLPTLAREQAAALGACGAGHPAPSSSSRPGTIASASTRAPGRALPRRSAPQPAGLWDATLLLPAAERGQISFRPSSTFRSTSPAAFTGGHADRFPNLPILRRHYTLKTTKAPSHLPPHP